MSQAPKYYIVEATALPEIFLKVAEAKRLLQTGEASTVNIATQMTGISRSAFYKYRDTVRPFQNMMIDRVITFQFILQDQKGQLAALLQLFTDHKTNIQTINSIIPTNGSALVTISAESHDMDIPLEEFLKELTQVPGVIKAEVLAG